jgi:hypothetical protein
VALMQILMRMLLLAIVCSYTVTEISGCAKKAPPPQSPVIGSRFRSSDSEPSEESSEPAPTPVGGPYAGYNGAPPPAAYSSQAPAPAPQPAPQVSITPAPQGKGIAREASAPAKPLWRRNSYRWVKENESSHMQRGPGSVSTEAGSRAFGSGRKNSPKRNLAAW